MNGFQGAILSPYFPSHAFLSSTIPCGGKHRLVQPGHSRPQHYGAKFKKLAAAQECGILSQGRSKMRR